MSARVVTTWLALDDPAALRPAPAPAVRGIEVTRVPPDGELSRWFYVEVGTAHGWTDHLGRSATDWRAWARRVETWVLAVEGRRAGFYELDPAGGGVELAYFGLLADFRGRGLGGFLLTHALRRGLALGDRVWLHTATTDGPAALPNYLARGLTAYRRDVTSA